MSANSEGNILHQIFEVKITCGYYGAKYHLPIANTLGQWNITQ